MLAEAPPAVPVLAALRFELLDEDASEDEDGRLERVAETCGAARCGLGILEGPASTSCSNVPAGVFPVFSRRGPVEGLETAGLDGKIAVAVEEGSSASAIFAIASDPIVSRLLLLLLLLPFPCGGLPINRLLRSGAVVNELVLSRFVVGGSCTLVDETGVEAILSCEMDTGIAVTSPASSLSWPFSSARPWSRDAASSDAEEVGDVEAVCSVDGPTVGTNW